MDITEFYIKEFPLVQHTILLTVGGSRACGIHTDASDVDLKGITVPPRRYLLGFNKDFDHYDADLSGFRVRLTDDEKEAAGKVKLEGIVYSLHKFFRLASAGNPTVLDILFCRDEEVRVEDSLGKTLRANREMFLSQNVFYSYGQHALGNIQRLRDDTPNFKFKHAAHAVRLMRMAKEILTTGQVRVWRGGIDRDELLQIRNGAWTLDYIRSWASEQMQELREAVQSGRASAVPDSVDMTALNDLCTHLTTRALETRL